MQFVAGPERSELEYQKAWATNIQYLFSMLLMALQYYSYEMKIR